MRYVVIIYAIAVLHSIAFAQDPDLEEAAQRLESVEQRGERYRELTREQAELEPELWDDIGRAKGHVRAVGDFVKPIAEVEEASSGILGTILASLGLGGPALGGIGYALYRSGRIRKPSEGGGVTVNVGDKEDAGDSTASGRFRSARQPV